MLIYRFKTGQVRIYRSCPLCYKQRTVYRIIEK
jgi:hypothetical protein